MNRRLAVTMLALLALVVGACSNASDDSGDDASGEGTAVTTDDGGPLTYAEVLELPIDENVPVQAPGVDDSTIRVGGVASTTTPSGALTASPSRASRPTSSTSTPKVASTAGSSSWPPRRTTTPASKTGRTSRTS